MFKPESLKKFQAKALEKIMEYDARDVEDIPLCISRGNRKIGYVMNVSELPKFTCGNCGHCLPYCYDIKACLQYETVMDARARNTVILRKDRNSYFRRIRNAIKRARKCRMFRWHVGGELPDIEYFSEMVNIARENPEWTFWTYTKMYWIVNKYCAEHGGTRECIPENLHVMFSKWDGVPMSNPYGFPEFLCKLKEGNKDTTEEEFQRIFKCPLNCDICKRTHRGCVVGETSYADEH